MGSLARSLWVDPNVWPGSSSTPALTSPTQDAKRFQPTTLSVSNLQNTGCSVGSVTRHHRLCAKSKRVQHHKHKLRKRFTSKLTVNRATTSEVDVVVIGGGIIGLCVAFQLLCHSSKPSVALVERQVPCSGATGAGQGYVWLAHRQPDTPGWAIAKRSKHLWERMLDTGHECQQSRKHISLSSTEDVEWQENGSMLLALSAEEAQGLQERAAMLQQNGIRAKYHHHKAVKQLEPALSLPQAGGALLVESDSQLSGRRAAAVLLQQCHEASGSSGRFHAHLNQPVESIHLSPQTDAVDGITTSSQRIITRKGVVLAAGAWSGSLLGNTTGDARWHEVFKPRRGHLLELDPPSGMPPLRHGLMEMGYTQHLHKSGPLDNTGTDIAFTATPSASGSCLIGSAREFSGWDTSPSQSVQDAIMDRASHFLPAFASHRNSENGVRVGLRPYALGGLPFIGPVPELPGLFLAAGHEGAGLTMAPATAELVVQHVMQESLSLQHQADAFLPGHRMNAAVAGMTSGLGHA